MTSSADTRFRERLTEFMGSGFRNKWIEDRELKLYVRRYQHPSLGRILDLSSIEASPPGKGIFSRRLKIIEEVCQQLKVEIVHVENVLAPRFGKFLERVGYVLVPGSHARALPCYIKTMRPEIKDPRIVCGANCTWWGSVHHVAKKNDLPVCPQCGGVLFEYVNEDAWNKAITAAVTSGQAVKLGFPDYPELVAFTKEKCFPSYNEVAAEFRSSKNETRSKE